MTGGSLPDSSRPRRALHVVALNDKHTMRASHVVALNDNGGTPDNIKG